MTFFPPMTFFPCILRDYAIPLILPTAAMRRVIASKGKGKQLDQYEFNLLCRRTHILCKMELYNPIFLSAIAIVGTSRIALLYTKEHSLSHIIARCGTKVGSALVAYTAVLGAIVYFRAILVHMDNYEYVKGANNFEEVRLAVRSRWF